MAAELHKFLFEGLPVRGMLVQMDAPWQELLERRSAREPWTDEVASLVGQLCAAGVLMHSNIKFAGALVLQISGDGPVKLAVAEVQPNLSFRATASVVGVVPPGASLESMVNVRGQGRCAITLDPHQRAPGQQPYQGVVALDGNQGEPLQQLSQVLEHYMLQSEQLDTRLVLAADRTRAAGLLIQRLPAEGEGNVGTGAREDAIGRSEDFNRIAHLAATLRADELLTLDADTVLRRLFWEEGVRRFEPRVPRFVCRCSRERVRSMLRGLGRDESDSLIAERGEVEVACEFCGQMYRFDAVDVGEMFTPPGQQPPGSSALN
ncbi:MAG: Hsp33 family molecular chaperone HslO [Rubrivivax sp.]